MNANTNAKEFITLADERKIMNLYLSIREHAETLKEAEQAEKVQRAKIDRLESTRKDLKTAKGQLERTDVIKTEKAVLKDCQNARKNAQEMRDKAYLAFEHLLENNQGKLWNVTKQSIPLTSIFCTLSALKWLIKGDARYDAQKALKMKAELFQIPNGLNVFDADAYLRKDTSSSVADALQECALAMLIALNDDGIDNAWRYAQNKVISYIRKQISVKANLNINYGISARQDDDGEYHFIIVDEDNRIDALLNREEASLILEQIKSEIKKHKDSDLMAIWGMLAKGYSFQKMANELNQPKSSIQYKIEKLRKIGQRLYPNFEPAYLYIECADSLTGIHAIAID